MKERKDPTMLVAHTSHGEERILMHPTGSVMIPAVGWSDYSGTLFVRHDRLNARDRVVQYRQVERDTYREIRKATPLEASKRLAMLVEAEGVPSTEVDWHEEPLQYCWAPTDGEPYRGRHATRLDALAEAAEWCGYDPDYGTGSGEETGAHVGYSVPIPISRYALDGDDWHEWIAERMWDDSAVMLGDTDFAQTLAERMDNRPQLEQLADEVAAVLNAWAHRYGYHPDWYDVLGDEWLPFELLRDA